MEGEERLGKLIYPGLSYTVNGILFNVHNTLGGGHKEKYYQKAVAAGLSFKNIKFEEQYYVPLKCYNKTIGKYYLDFLIQSTFFLT